MHTKSNENILATRQKFFFRKVAPVQSITDIVLLDFCLVLPSWMFISFYTTIYFFVKKFIFSNVCIFMNTIFESLYIFFGWEREHQLSTYATGGGGMGSHPKCAQLRTGRGGVTCIIFCFIEFSTKVSPNSSRGGWLFYAEVRSLLSKIIFTHFVSCWSRSHEIVKK